MDKLTPEYVQKLEARIHNQRVALRENWMITEERAKHGGCRHKTSIWFHKALEYQKEIRKLKAQLEVCRQPFFHEEPHNNEDE